MHPTFLTPYIIKKYPNAITICNKNQSIAIYDNKNGKIYHLFDVDCIHFKRIILKDDKLHIKANCQMTLYNKNLYDIDGVIKIYDDNDYYEVPYCNGIIKGRFIHRYKNNSFAAWIDSTNESYTDAKNLSTREYCRSLIDICVSIINRYKV